MKTLTHLTALVAVAVTTPAMAGNCGGQPTAAYRPPVAYNPVPTCTNPAYCPPTTYAPIDDGYAYEDDYLYEDAYYDDEGALFDDATEFDAPAKVVECEVQVQHPLTFAWKTVKTFDDELTAEEYKAQIENRCWVIYQPAGTTQPKFLEAKNRGDASSKATALRSAGAKINKIEQVQALVSEKPLQPLFEDEAALEVAITEFATPKVPNDIEPLLGLWEAVTMNAEGEVQKLLLDLNPNGDAKLTAPTAAGGQATLQRPFAIEDGLFKLGEGEDEMILGEVLSADADEVVLAREEGEITFTRP